MLGYTVSTEKGRLDIEAIHGFLRTSYWSPGLPLETLQRAIAGSICFGLYDGAGQQAGFARVITDSATFAYLCDVFVLEQHRGKGLGVWMMENIMAHPQLQGLRRFQLVTRDAHELYAKFGFRPLGNPPAYMEIYCPPQ